MRVPLGVYAAVAGLPADSSLGSAGAGDELDDEEPHAATATSVNVTPSATIARNCLTIISTRFRFLVSHVYVWRIVGGIPQRG
jgi:hypothetical protein